MIPGGRGWGGAKLGLHHSCLPSEFVAQIPRARPLLSPPCEGGVRGGGPVSVECTRETCLARSVNAVDGVCAASPASTACRFRASLQANVEYTDEAEFLRLTPLYTPPPPFTRGERKRHRLRARNENARFVGRRFNPVNSNFAPRHGGAVSNKGAAEASSASIGTAKLRLSQRWDSARCRDG